MWVRNLLKIKKAKQSDYKQYGKYGYECTFGYLPYQDCLDMAKLNRLNESIADIAVLFDVSFNDAMTIVTYWSQYIAHDADLYNIVRYGGKEYSERRTKLGEVINQDAVYDVLMDIELFNQNGGKLE
jgi:hypothetical protein